MSVSRGRISLFLRMLLPTCQQMLPPSLVMAYQREPGGDFVNTSGCLDGKVNETVRIHLDAANLPAGWAVTDEGKFFVGYSSTDGDYDVGDTGGFKWHGYTENNHADHMVHEHTIGNLMTELDLFGDLNFPHVRAPVTNGPSQAGVGMEMRHGGPYNAWPAQFPVQEAHAGADTDNRPPFITRVWIKRTS